MHRMHRTPVHTHDCDGREIVLVSLANHDRPAKLLVEDWKRLVREEVSQQWTLNKGAGIAYVRCGAKRPGNLDTVARLIMRAGAGQMVGYCSEDRLNLRRDNLRIKVRSVRRRPARTPAEPPQVAQEERPDVPGH
jgi:hypothetical protein